MIGRETIYGMYYEKTIIRTVKNYSFPPRYACKQTRRQTASNFPPNTNSEIVVALFLLLALCCFSPSPISTRPNGEILFTVSCGSLIHLSGNHRRSYKGQETNEKGPRRTPRLSDSTFTSFMEGLIAVCQCQKRIDA